jgi:hypothetical protein
MKKLALFALSIVATAAMAAGPAPESEIKISGYSEQAASISNADVSNNAYGAQAQAQQNLASNVGDISIKGDSHQSVTVNGGAVTNKAYDYTVAQQNLSSNIGEVEITGTSYQTTVARNSYISNEAWGRDAMAVQNIASNNSCFVCEGTGNPHKK